MRQRIVGIALGYEDLNDHEPLRLDSLLALLCGKSDLSGEKRNRSRDKGVPLAGASTLNRMELGKPDQAPSDRYRKIVADPTRMDRLFVDLFTESYDSAPEEIWLDLDATDDLVHGQQEFRFYYGYYDALDIQFSGNIFAGFVMSGNTVRAADLRPIKMIFHQ